MLHVKDNYAGVIAQAIEADVHLQETMDYDLNPCICQNDNCELATGIETSLVAMTAHWLIEKMRVEGREADYQENVFMPSRRAEARGGFDLSLGHYATRHRVRTMHKVLYGRYWCDEAWSWKTRLRGNDWKHLRSLIQLFERDGGFRPYLTFHVCFCVHDYRRMGKMLGDIPIPAFENILRTVVVDLGEIVRQRGMPENNGTFIISKQSHKRIQNEAATDYLVRIAAKDLFDARITGDAEDVMLPILSLSELYDLNRDFLLLR